MMFNELFSTKGKNLDGVKKNNQKNFKQIKL